MKRKLYSAEREQLIIELDILSLLSDENNPGIVKLIDIFEDT